MREEDSEAVGPAGDPHPLAHAGFRLLLGSSVASATGGAITAVSVNWLVYEVTGSTLDVAYVGLTGILPGIGLGLFAGVLADRYDRRRIMVWSDVIRMAVMAMLAAAIYLAGFSLVLILAAMTLVYSFTALFTPASQAILPRIVRPGQLESANGLLSGLTQLGFSIGSGAGGLIVVLLGAVDGFGVNAATYALSALLLFRIAADVGRPEHRPPGTRRSIRADIGEGVAYMRAHRPVLALTIGGLPANFLFTMFASYFVVYAATLYGSDAAAYGYIVAGLAAGAVVGSLAVAPLRARRFAGRLLGVSVLASGGTIGLMVVARSLPISVAGAVGTGVLTGIIITTYYSTMQAIVPNAVLARVLSIDTVGSFAAIPGGILAGGLLASAHGILFVYAVAALGLVLTGAGLLAVPEVRSLRYEPGHSR